MCPVLHTNDEDFMITRILQQLSVQDSPEVQVPLNPRRSVGFHIPTNKYRKICGTGGGWFPHLVWILVSAHVQQLKGALLVLQLFGWKLRRSKFKGLFSHFFLAKKRCENWAAVECAAGSALQPVHSASLW